jgi:hypothetical protein
MAASWKDKRIFLIELLDDAYEEHRSFLQRGRENVLMRQFLEREVRRRTNEIRAREEEIASENSAPLFEGFRDSSLTRT